MLNNLQKNVFLFGGNYRIMYICSIIIKTIEIMIKQEIKANLEQATYFYNQNDNWALDFWREAVAKCPKLVEKDFKELNEAVKNDEDFGDPDGFKLNETYKEMFKNLNLN